MGISNGVHPILTIRCFVFCEVPMLGSNFEIYKLFRHVHGVFDKGMFFWHKLFLYIRIYMMFSCQLCWQPALLAIYKKECIYIYINIYIQMKLLYEREE